MEVTYSYNIVSLSRVVFLATRFLKFVLAIHFQKHMFSCNGPLINQHQVYSLTHCLTASSGVLQEV